MTRENPRIAVVTIAQGQHALRASQPRATFAALDRFLNARNFGR
jgi:hypothetical protein